MTASRSSTTARLSRGCGGAARRLRDERGAAFLPMTGLLAALLGLSAVLANLLGVSGRDAQSLATRAATSGAATLSGSLSGLDPAEARWRASRLDPRPACRAAEASAAPDARITTCSIVDTNFVVVVTTDAPASTASATIGLTGGPPP